jgi:hypothetical protein
LIGLLIVAGLAVIGAIIGVSVHLYYSYPRTTRNWPDKEIESNGVKASLKTRWRDDTLYYQLRILPSPPNTFESFDEALRSSNEPLRFTVFLYDDSGFEMCSNSISESDIHKNVNTEEQTKDLSANGIWLYCSLEHYNDSDQWGLAWHSLPKLSATATDIVGTSKAAKTDEPKKLEGHTTLTGVSFMGSRLDTESGQAFLLYRSGERNTIMWWSAKEKVHFECKTPSDCVIVNETREETVHARLIQ